MEKLIDIYKSLVYKYNNLCFKVKENDKFVLGIVSNNGPIIIKLDKKYYEEFNVKKIYDLNSFQTLTYASINILNNTDFDNVSYFIILENTLYDYYGNTKNVIVPSNVYKINYECFKDNTFIENVYAPNTTEIDHYAFRNNPNLKSLHAPNSIWIGNILNCPKLKEYTISPRINGFINEDNNYENSIIHVMDTTYTFDNTIEKDFMNKFDVIKENDNEEIQLVKFNKNERLFRSVKDDKRNNTIVALANFERLFSLLPEYIKEIFYYTNHELYIVDSLPDGGWYLENEKSIILHRDGISISFYHEIGHMIDVYLDYISSSFDFIRIYQMEANNLYSKKIDLSRYRLFDHCTKDEHEYFAESVKRYLNNDNTFKLECPNTYIFINEVFKELEYKYNSNNSLKLDK